MQKPTGWFGGAAAVAVALVVGALFPGGSVGGPAAAAQAAAAPAPPAPPAVSPDDGTLQERIVAKEREGLAALKSGEVDRFASLTDDQALLVDDHGPVGKAQLIKNVGAFRLTDFSISDVKFLRLAPQTGLISYLLVEAGTSHGKQFKAQAYVSSIWTERAGAWVCLFSQETLRK